ncbi:hypothetical protein OC844_006522 [Tilletia horrida]|nr:hypothetical protein OC844_006522 [Tilletia horrida]
MASSGPSSKPAFEIATPPASAVPSNVATPVGSTPPPAKIPKRRGRPPGVRNSVNADDASSNASNVESPPKQSLPPKKRGRPPGVPNKAKATVNPPPHASANAPLPHPSSVIISSLAYTPPDPSNHPLRKNAKIEPAPPLSFDNTDNTQLSPSAASTGLIPTQFSTPRHVPSRSKTRIFELEEAPIFYPTIEEWSDPIKYIAWIASPEGGNAKDYGIAKIVPPEGWAPEFVLDHEKFRFRTRVQRLHQLSAEARATLNYHEQLQKFHSQQGSKRVSIPIIDRRPTDLYKLRRVVDANGGFDAVVKGRKWTEVTRKMGYPDKDCAQLSAQVKAAYIKIIMPFEDFLLKAKEQGRTVNFSAAPTNTGGPSMTMAGSAPLQSASAVTNGAPQLQMTIKGTTPPVSSAVVDKSRASTPAMRPEPSQASQEPTVGTGNDSVSASGNGLAAASADTTMATANASQPGSNNGTPSSSRIVLKVDGQTRPAAAAAALALANGGTTQDTKTWSEELLAAGLTPEEIAQIEAEAAGKRRSARKRTETTSQPAPLTPSTSRKRKNLDDGQTTVIELLTTQGAEEQMCEICLRGDNGTSMLLCDDCNRGYHMFCLDPPLTTIPKSQWFCPPCLVGTGNDFGFDDGETHSLHSFWVRAGAFRNQWWSMKKRSDEDSTMRAAMFGQVISEGAGQFGAAASSPSSTTGPAAETNGMAQSPKLGGEGDGAAAPKSPAGDVVMQDASKKVVHASASISSAKSRLNSPVESEHNVHHGWTRPIPGCEYSVSEDDIEREYWRLVSGGQEAVEVEYGADIHTTTHGSALPTLETHPESPYSKDSWNLNNLPITPGSLLRYIKSDISGMTVPWIYVGMMFSTFCWHNEDHFTYSVNYQHWGETKTWYGVPGADAEKFEEAMRRVAPDLFETSPDLLFQLVTMMSPERLREQGVRVYAADQRPNEFVITFPKAYHSGFNQGFNLNEAVNFALPDWIDTGFECVKRYQHYRKFPVFSHDELLCNILHHHLNIHSAIWLAKPIGDMVDREMVRRNKLRRLHPGVQDRLDETVRPEADYQCAHCNTFSYLSQVVCSSRSQVACVDHVSEVFGAEDAAKLTLRLRFSDEYLGTMRSKVTDKASQPAGWKSRFRKLLLTSPRPSLKTLKTLLADGERIAGMPEVEQLRQFVDKAVDWVNRASALVTRKHHRAVLDPPSVRSRTGGLESDISADYSSAKDGERERTADVLFALLQEVDNLGFDTPEIGILNGIANEVTDFRKRVADVFAADAAGKDVSLADCYEIQELGEDTNIDMPERRDFAAYLDRRSWFSEANEYHNVAISVDHAGRLLSDAQKCQIDASEPLLVDIKERVELGEQWVKRARAVASRQAPSSRVTLEELDELLGADTRVPTDEDLRATLDSMHKKFIDCARSFKSIMNTQKDKNQRYLSEQRAEDPAAVLQRARSTLQLVDKLHLAVPNTEIIRSHIERTESWIKRFEDVVLEAFSPYSTPSRGRLEAMMDALCTEISHTADPWDHYPISPPRRHCVCRTLERPPEVHRDVRVCTSCMTIYHLPCLKIEEKWTYKDWELASRTWKCPICDPAKLPALLQHRQTLALSSITPLVKEDAWHVENFLFIPSRWFALRKALDRLEGLTTAVGDFLAKNPTPAVIDNAYMLWHSLRKVLACPVDVTLADGVSVVDAICTILYRFAGLDENGEPIPAKPRGPIAAPPPQVPAHRGDQRPAPSTAPATVAPPDARPQQAPSVMAAPPERSPYGVPAQAPFAPPNHQSPYGASPSLAPRSTPKQPFAPMRSPLPQSRDAVPPREHAPAVAEQRPVEASKRDIAHVQDPAIPQQQRRQEAAQAGDANLPPPQRPASSLDHSMEIVESSGAARQPQQSHAPQSSVEGDSRKVDAATSTDPPVGQATLAPASAQKTVRSPMQQHQSATQGSQSSGAQSDQQRPPQIAPAALHGEAQDTTRPRDAASGVEQTAHDQSRGANDPDVPQRDLRREGTPSDTDRHSDHGGEDGRNDSEAPGSPPTLQSLPKKRGKRAKLVFEEEVGSVIPVNGTQSPCLCRTHREVEMISCERCANWFHLDCVVVTSYQAKTDKRWSCPFCCLKTERKYQYAEVKVKDSACPPGVYVDVRATLRSTDEVIRKPQHWMLSNHRRIVLHLHEFVPAVAAGIPTSGKSRGDKDDGEGTPMSREGSARGSVLHDLEPSGSGPSSSPTTSRPNVMLPGEHSRTYAQQMQEASSGSRGDQNAQSSSRSQASSSQQPAAVSEAQAAQERHRLGMQNLYSRGVTDAMIAKWYIGWDGQKLVYPHYDRNGRVVELELGSSIHLGPDDPDGSKFIHAKLALRAEEERLERGQLSSFHSRSPPTRPFGGPVEPPPRQLTERARERVRPSHIAAPSSQWDRYGDYDSSDSRHRESDPRFRGMPPSGYGPPGDSPQSQRYQRYPEPSYHDRGAPYERHDDRGPGGSWVEPRSRHGYDAYTEPPQQGGYGRHPSMRPYDYDTVNRRESDPFYRGPPLPPPRDDYSYGGGVHPSYSDHRSPRESWQGYGDNRAYGGQPRSSYPRRSSPPYHGVHRAQASSSRRGRERGPSYGSYGAGPGPAPAPAPTPFAPPVDPSRRPVPPAITRAPVPSPQAAGSSQPAAPAATAAAAAAAAAAAGSPSLSTSAMSSMSSAEREAERRLAKDLARKLRPEMSEEELEKSVQLILQG